MKCCFCGKWIDEGFSLIPIEPKGTKDRKWSCIDCFPRKIEIVATEVKEICSIFDEKFNEL